MCSCLRPNRAPGGQEASRTEGEEGLPGAHHCGLWSPSKRLGSSLGWGEPRGGSVGSECAGRGPEVGQAQTGPLHLRIPEGQG